MSAGDRSKTGQPKDFVRHYEHNARPICGTTGYGYMSVDYNETDCKRCIKAINKGKLEMGGFTDRKRF